MSTRDLILGRIDEAIKPVAVAPDAINTAYEALPRNYVRQGRLEPKAVVELLIDRLKDYDTVVECCQPGDLLKVIAAHIEASGRKKLVAPEGLPAAWMVQEAEWVVDHQLSHDEVNACEGVVTEAFCGIADSGTIVLHHSPEEGRRVLTLLPDWHLCILRMSQVVETYPEYVARCTEAPRLATNFSGPSATADIEMTRIKGVHGPRFLEVILVEDV